MLNINDLVTVKATSPKYKWYKDKVGIIHQIPAQPIIIGGDADDIVIKGNRLDSTPTPDVIVNFDGLECAFNKNELKKV